MCLVAVIRTSSLFFEVECTIVLPPMSSLVAEVDAAGQNGSSPRLCEGSDDEEFFDAPATLSQQRGTRVQWEVRYDPNYRSVYYYNVNTFESRWTEPDKNVVESDLLNITETSHTEEVEATDIDWERLYDEEHGWYYFYNKLTRESRWEGDYSLGSEDLTVNVDEKEDCTHETTTAVEYVGTNAKRDPIKVSHLNAGVNAVALAWLRAAQLQKNQMGKT